MPGARAQFCHLPSPGISNQSRVRGNTGWEAGGYLVSTAMKSIPVCDWAKNADSEGRLSRFKSWSSAYYPGKGSKPLCVQASCMETGLLGGCYEIMQVKCSIQGSRGHTSHSVKRVTHRFSSKHTCFPPCLWQAGDPETSSPGSAQDKLGQVTSFPGPQASICSIN